MQSFRLGSIFGFEIRIDLSEEQMTQVLQKMQESGARRVLVTQNGLLKGIITANDIANWLQRQREFCQVA